MGKSQWSSNDDPNNAALNLNGTTWVNQIEREAALLPTGGEVQATAQTTNRNGVLPEGYLAGFGIQLQQPLLKGFGADVNQANIYLAQRDYRISLSEFKQKAIGAVASTWKRPISTLS